MRNVERDFGVARGVLERVRKLMDQATGDALIGRYHQHERLFAKTNAKDRHVAAAAVVARKRSGIDIVTIFTWNLKDFDRQELAEVGVAAETPDAFLCPRRAHSYQNGVRDSAGFGRRAGQPVKNRFGIFGFRRIKIGVTLNP